MDTGDPRAHGIKERNRLVDRRGIKARLWKW
jgi:hypothetical protein